MKRVMRFGTFETNSSSQHSFAYMSRDVYEKWKSGKYYVDFGSLAADPEDLFLPELGAYDAEPFLLDEAQVAKLCEEGAVNHDEEHFGKFKREDYLVHLGVLPHEVISAEPDRDVSRKWAAAGGGVTYVEEQPQPDGGYTVVLERYDW